MVDTTPSVPEEEPSKPNVSRARGDDETTSAGDSDVPVTEEITLRDGESVTLSAPTDGTAHIVVNLVQPPRSTGFFGSCLQGCGCLVLVVVVLAALGSALR